MPRSSGGGSHSSGGSRSHSSGGGSHRSGGSRSHSSGGGSHSGGGNSLHRSSSHFFGSTRYVYYRHKKPVYFYANYDPAKKYFPWFFMLLFYVSIFVIVILLLFSCIHNPVKLSTVYDTRIVISDGADVIEDKAKLETSLRAFYEKTGITPAVMTVHNEEWIDRYSDMETYVYDLYVNKFWDEKHWLIVYSQPEKPKKEFNDWYWEGMQGDDTVGILTGSVCDDFNAKLQRYLMSDNFYTVGEAIGTAFDELTPVVMKIKFQFGLNAIVIIIVLIQVSFLTIIFRCALGDPRERKAVGCPEYAKEAVCDYCGGIYVYVAGRCITCPHCNAPLKAHNPYNQETDDFGYGASAGTVNLNGEEIKL